MLNYQRVTIRDDILDLHGLVISAGFPAGFAWDECEYRGFVQ